MKATRVSSWNQQDSCMLCLAEESLPVHPQPAMPDLVASLPQFIEASSGVVVLTSSMLLLPLLVLVLATPSCGSCSCAAFPADAAIPPGLTLLLLFRAVNAPFLVIVVLLLLLLAVLMSCGCDVCVSALLIDVRVGRRKADSNFQSRAEHDKSPQTRHRRQYILSLLLVRMVTDSLL